MRSSDLPLICYEGGGEPFSRLLPRGEGSDCLCPHRLGGGLALRRSRLPGKRTASRPLGRRILRCETAPIAALTAVMLLAGEME